MKLPTLKNWIRALRGQSRKKYKQTTSRLKHDTKEAFCCMGVLADLAGGEWKKGRDGYPTCYLDDERHTSQRVPSGLVKKLLVEAGVKCKNQAETSWVLAGANDHGASFKKIAAGLEKCLKNPERDARVTLEEHFAA